MVKNSRKIVIAHNVSGHGTNNITRLVLSTFSSKGCDILFNKQIFKDLECDSDNFTHVGSNSFSQVIYFISLAIKSFFHPVDTTIVLANYFPYPIRSNRKVVILRHPFIVDSLDELPPFRRVKERTRRLAFRLTLLFGFDVVVQTDYMYKKFLNKYHRMPIMVLPNPLGLVDSVKSIRKEPKIVYPSGYYSHKRHKELVNVWSKLMDKSLQLVIYTGRFEANRVIDKGVLGRAEILEDIRTSSAIVFPSKNETFGNGIYEALHFCKSIIVNSSASYTYDLRKYKNVFFYDFDNSDLDKFKIILNKAISNIEWTDYKDISPELWVKKLMDEK